MKRLKAPLAYAFIGILALSACQPTPTTLDPTPTASSPPQATPTPQASTSAEPIPISTPAPTPEPIATPTPIPTAEPTPTPVPTATDISIPSASPTSTPTPSATPEATTGTITVDVFDDNTNLVSAAQVTVKSAADDSFSETTFTNEGGHFILKDLPLNTTLNIKATAPGYTTRERLLAVSVFTPEKTLEFKGDDAISNRPEVIEVKQGNAINTAYQPLEMSFSEGLDRESFERSFALQLDTTSSTNFKVGTPTPVGTSIGGNQNNVVFDIQQFNVEWDTSKTVRLTPQFGWPQTSRDDYRIVLNYRKNGDPKGGGIKDSGGTSARESFISSSSGGDTDTATTTESGPFRVGNQYKAFWRLRINTSPTPIKLDRVSVTKSPQDILTLDFDNDLSFTLPNGASVVGGAGGQASNAPAATGGVSATDAAQNYVMNCGGPNLVWPAGTVAIYATQRQVQIIVPAGTDLLPAGTECNLTVNGILDPRGERISGTSFSVRIP